MKNNRPTNILISVLAAFCLWLYVITTVSPGYNDTIHDIRVSFEGETLLNERGMMITNGLDAYVDLTLTGNRSDFLKINPENITVKVDLTKIYEPGIKQLDTTVVFPADVAQDAFIIENKYPGKVPITVEKKMEKYVDVDVEFTGAVDEGFIADSEDYLLDYPQVKITGPASVVEQIAAAQIVVDLTDRTESISEDYRFRLCDAEGNPVDVAQVTTDVAEVHLDVKIQRWKEIPLRVNLTYGGGALEKNTSLTIDPQVIRVSGSELVLADLEEIVLGSVDLSTLEENLSQTFAITMPEGVTNMTGKTEAKVEISFQGLMIREFDVSQIRVINVPEGMDYDLLNEVVRIKLRGSSVLINQLKSEDIQLTVDLAGKELGSFTVKATLSFRDNRFAEVGLVGPHSVSVTLMEHVEEATEG